MKKKITTWYRYNRKTKEWIFNHIENGHCKNDSPTSKFESQRRSWKSEKWSKKYADLINRKVVEYG